MESSPRISVIMSVYNSAPFLKEAVDSILNQTFGDFEFLIIDDKSSDNSLEILKSYNDSRIQIFENSENIGLTKSLNKLLALAKGEFIARMDSDDISLPERFEKQVAYLEDNEDVDLCGTQTRSIGESNEVNNLPTEYQHIKFHLLFQNPIAHPSVLMRSKLVKIENLIYDENYKTSQDYELWSRIAINHKITNLSESLIQYRFHEGQVSEQKSVNQKQNALRIKKKYLALSGFIFHEQYPIEFDCMFDTGFIKNQCASYVFSCDNFMNMFVIENRNKNVFKEEYILEHWIKVFFGSYFIDYNLEVWKYLRDSKINLYKKVNYKNYLKQLFKCLIAWKVVK